MPGSGFRPPSSPRPDFSLVVPLYNEEENVDALVDELEEVLIPLGAFEVLAVDDGSTDRTLSLLLKRQKTFPQLRIVKLAKNSGQSTAVCAGFDQARADIVLMMDGDLQNDPHDFPKILEALKEADGVSGARIHRKDPWIRRISSKVANFIRNKLSGDHVIDSASGIKGFRKEVLSKIPRFNGMHRFLPTLVRMVGGKVVEVPVNHRERHAGTAKYGVGNRAFRAFRDLLGVRWLKSRLILYECELLIEDREEAPKERDKAC
ncbi:MAG TPA: glycosyltransferase [Planctomycetes bacterium]|nr:glycosyltransferase [Planctomycetota bacterium]